MMFFLMPAAATDNDADSEDRVRALPDEAPPVDALG
jgi:hypothetical protein